MKQPSNLPQNSPPDLQNQGRALTFMPTGLWMLFSIVLMFTVSYLISDVYKRQGRPRFTRIKSFMFILQLF